MICNKKKRHIPRLVVEYGSLTSELGKPFEIFDKFVRVFDLYFVATPSSPAEKLLHGATILYQYIDNNGDGEPDNLAVYFNLRLRQATMVMFRDGDECEEKIDEFLEGNKACKNVLIEDLESDETGPELAFDEGLEECFHFLNYGYSLAYPDVFGDQHGTQLASCCDRARGGYFPEIPKQYPPSAWFTYFDPTCEYSCQITEYAYWAMTSILGAQAKRIEVMHEWKLITKDLVMTFDPEGYALLTDPRYRLPTRIPTGLLERGSWRAKLYRKVSVKFNIAKKGFFRLFKSWIK